MASVKLEDIKYVKVCELSSQEQGQQMLNGEIPGAGVTFYRLSSKEKRFFKGEDSFIRVLFLCQGDVTFSGSGKECFYCERAVYTDMPGKNISVFTKDGCGLLEVKWVLNQSDKDELNSKSEQFPFTQAYKDALQYRDPFKSETTISRAIIIHDFIPRFAMGSVEAKGDDLVGQHAHPLLDQFFFSFSENDADLLIDCRIFNFKGDTLMHIPLGSNHGVIARGSQRMHYLWIDFTPASQKEDAVAYLNEVHKPTGVKEELK